MTKAQPNLQLLHVPPLPSGRGKRTAAQQSQSPFFRLPLELRRLILCEAFGGRTIHIDLRPPLATPNLRQFGGKEKSWPDWRRLIPGLTAKPDDRRWVWAGHYFSHDGPAQTEGRNGWGHHIPTIPSKGMDGGPCCWNGDDARPRRDARRIGVMGFLLSCRRAYGDALFVLYTTNTIALQREGVIDGLLRQTVIPNAPRLTGNGMRLVTSLQVRFPLTLWPSPFYPDDADHAHAAKNRAVLAEQLELLPRAFPNLWNLTWIPSQYVYDCADYFPPGQLDELEELLLGPLLRFSTTMPPLRKFIVPIPYQLFFTVIVLEQQRPEGRQDFSGQSLGKIRIWYPFTLSPGTLGPDGGGFWLVYGEVYHRKLVYDGTAYGQKLV